MINKVILVGNLGKDPEIRTMSNSKQVANFSVATTESWNDRNTGERVSKTEWHNVVVFNEGLVKIVQNYIKKGTRIYLEGSLQTRKWTDNSGNDRYTTEVVLNQYSSAIKILSSKNQQEYDEQNTHLQPQNTERFEKNTQQQEQLKHSDLQTESTEADDDDIPF